MSLVLEHIETPTDDVRTLIAELDAELSGHYASAQRHGLSIARIFHPGVLFFIARLNGDPVGCGGVAPVGSAGFGSSGVCALLSPGGRDWVWPKELRPSYSSQTTLEGDPKNLQIIRCLGILGTNAVHAVPALQKLLAHQESQVRSAATNALIFINFPPLPKRGE